MITLSVIAVCILFLLCLWIGIISSLISAIFGAAVWLMSKWWFWILVVLGLIIGCG